MRLVRQWQHKRAPYYNATVMFVTVALFLPFLQHGGLIVWYYIYVDRNQLERPQNVTTYYSIRVNLTPEQIRRLKHLTTDLDMSIIAFTKEALIAHMELKEAEAGK